MARSWLAVRRLPAGLLVLAAGLVGMLAVTPSADAYGPSYIHWPHSKSGEVCFQSSMTVHPSWTGYLDDDLDQYNNISSSYTHPHWANSCAASSISWDRISLASGLCGRTDVVWNSSNTITSAEVHWTTRYSYYLSITGANQCTFDYAALHEFGHSQGLTHSCNSSAIMYYTDNGATNLTSDDKYGYRFVNDPNFFGPPNPDNPPCNQ
jgi:hypothetical protein